MNHRATTRGLAASAVTALAVTGLAVGFAPAAHALDEDVYLISPFNAGRELSLLPETPFASPVAELAALRLDPAATVTFEYNTDPAAPMDDPGWTLVAGTVEAVGEYHTIDWAAPVELAGTSIALRAVADIGGTDTYSAKLNVPVSDSLPSVDVRNTAETGYFTQPYASSGRTATLAGVHGCTSATDGPVAVSWFRESDRTFQGQVAAALTGVPCKTIPFDSGARFAGTFDPTSFGAGDGDIVAFGAERETDDVQPTQLYPQVIAGLNAFSEQVPEGRQAQVQIEVTDDRGQGVAGAEVRRSADGSLVGYTAGDGFVLTTQPGGSTVSYYVNTTDGDAYDAGTDFQYEYQAQTYVQTPTTVEMSYRDGAVFDDDEYAPGDLAVVVRDELGEPMIAGTDVSYRVYPTGTTPPAVYATAPTDADGRVPVAFDPGGPDGGYTVDYRLASAPPEVADSTSTFTAGQSTLVLTPKAGTSSAGGQVAFSATLAVAGEPLPGRRVQARYQRGVEAVPGTKPDAAILAGSSRVLTRVLATDAAGTATFVVDDLAEKPQGAETGGRLTLTTLAGTGDGPTGNPGASAAGTTAFGKGKGKVKLKLTGKAAGSNADKLVVKGPTSVARESVKVFRVVAGKKVLLKTKKLNRKGDLAVTVKDGNAGGPTTYVVKLLSSARVKGSSSNKVTVR